MIFGHKSDLKNHLSAKKPTFSHKVVARPTHGVTMEMDFQEEHLPEEDHPPKFEDRELVETR
jgi:hypothetical protein